MKDVLSGDVILHPLSSGRFVFDSNCCNFCLQRPTCHLDWLREPRDVLWTYFRPRGMWKMNKGNRLCRENWNWELEQNETVWSNEPLITNHKTLTVVWAQINTQKITTNFHGSFCLTVGFCPSSCRLLLSPCSACLPFLPSLMLLVQYSADRCPL